MPWLQDGRRPEDGVGAEPRAGTREDSAAYAEQRPVGVELEQPERLAAEQHCEANLLKNQRQEAHQWQEISLHFRLLLFRQELRRDQTRRRNQLQQDLS